MAAERLQKLIAAAGLCSRRQADALLSAGRVLVDGRVAQLGERVDLNSVNVSVDGQPLLAPPEPLLLLLNKPVGVISSCADPRGRTTVLDLLPSQLSRGQGLHPVGRLDADSRGALLLTNQGAITLRLTHPRYGHRKTYRVWVEGQPGSATLERWRRGVALDGQPAQPVAVKLRRGSGQSSCLELVMGEGRNRQIRRTAALLGHPVLDLQRIAIGDLRLNDLPEGQWRRLDHQEWQALSQPI
jgi:pseudouridine synthase